MLTHRCELAHPGNSLPRAALSNGFGMSVHVLSHMQGKCTLPPPPRALDPPLEYPLSGERCVLYVADMLLRMPFENSGGIWLDNLYIRVLRAVTEYRQIVVFLQPTAVGNSIYLTNMTFQGDQGRARAVDVRDQSELYGEGSTSPSKPTNNVAFLHYIQSLCQRIICSHSKSRF
jgi:hypothetical protein